MRQCVLILDRLPSLLDRELVHALTATKLSTKNAKLIYLGLCVGPVGVINGNDQPGTATVYAHKPVFD